MIKLSEFYSLINGNEKDNWKIISKTVLEIMSQPIINNPQETILQRERLVSDFDYYLSTVAWELWELFHASIPKTSKQLVEWWSRPFSHKAVLILDGLSLRELPWFIKGASDHHVKIDKIECSGAEFPSETTPFARALGLNQRSDLSSNRLPVGFLLDQAKTDSNDLPWLDCANLITAEPNWVIWHQWPDTQIHDVDFSTFQKNTMEQLTGNEFWSFVKKLATGRKLIITSDHGYAISSNFPNEDGEIKDFLQKSFRSGRSTNIPFADVRYFPPVAMTFESQNISMVLGRRKWRSQGGYPNLTHGGLTLLEVLSPWLELSF